MFQLGTKQGHSGFEHNSGPFYHLLVSLPLVYFLSQFVSYSLNLFASLLTSDPIFYGTLLSVLFTVSKAAGGILFGVAFWTMARSLRQGSAVRDYMIVSAFGFALLFVSNQAILLSNAFYPPFGHATVSFMGLSCYLILVGIYSSAISVSEDSILRQSIRSIAIKESRLLDSIGMAEMEQQIQKKVIEFTKRNQERMAEESGIQSSLTEDDIKQYLEQVIKEVKKPKMNDDPNNA
jgi:DNA-binding protein Fis